MNHRVGIIIIIILASSFVVSCGQVETRRLVAEMNANRAKSQELYKQAQAKAALARKQSADGQTDDTQKTMQDEADIYGQIAKLFNASADKADKVVSITTTDWQKEYFKLYSKWTRNLAQLAAGAQEELMIRKAGTPTEDQVTNWNINIVQIRKENDTLQKQIAKLESEHQTVLVSHD
jgi:hypothetical protein